MERRHPQKTGSGGQSKSRSRPDAAWGLHPQQPPQQPQPQPQQQRADASERLPLDPQNSVSSSFSDGAFECESPAVLMASKRSQQQLLGAPPSSAAVPYVDFEDDSGDPRQYHQYVTTQQQQHMQLASQSINSEDLLEDGQVAYGELAQPRAEIVLRWKRFAILVLVAVAFISSATTLLVHGIEMKRVDASKAEGRVDYLNSLFGVAMGFFESILGLLLGNLFPVFIVYLHNLKWFPGDDPAVKASKFKRIALMLFIPLIMVALGNSFSAVQANQHEADDVSRMRTRHLMQQQQEPNSDRASAVTSRASLQRDANVDAVVLPLDETILSSAVTRRVIPAPPASASSCSTTTAPDSGSSARDEFDGILQALPTAAFGFPLKSWNKHVYPDPALWSATKTTTITQTSQGEDALTVFAAPSTAFELLRQGLAQMSALVNGASKMDYSSVNEILSGAKPANASNLLLEIAHGLQRLGLDGREAMKLEAMSVTLQQSPLSSLIQLESMTLEIPLTSASSSKSRVACGSQSCVLLVDGDGDATPRLPRKQISMVQYCAADNEARDKQTQNEDECRAEENAAFLFGFTSTISTTSSDSSSSSSVQPKRSLVLSFGKLSWTFDDFLDTCEPSNGAAGDCRVLHHRLSSSSQQHLVLGAKFLPESLQLSSSAPRSNAPGPVRLVQLVERKAGIATSALSQTVELVSAGNSLLSPHSDVCSAAVDSYQQYVSKNRLYLDQHLVQPMYTAALLYLFQNAAVVDGGATAELAVARRRQRMLSAQAEGDKTISIFISNTRVGQVSTWIGCGVLLILSVLVIVLPNERARLEPSKGGNARAERFIAVQTEEAYPNFVYKKRFLIGKTGEEIKFGEFAVESVGLHHKMEVDEQIYL